MNQTSLMEASENLIDKQIEYSKALTAYNGRKSENIPQGGDNSFQNLLISALQNSTFSIICNP